MESVAAVGTSHTHTDSQRTRRELLRSSGIFAIIDAQMAKILLKLDAAGARRQMITAPRITLPFPSAIQHFLSFVVVVDHHRSPRRPAAAAAAEAEAEAAEEEALGSFE